MNLSISVLGGTYIFIEQSKLFTLFLNSPTRKREEIRPVLPMDLNKSNS